MNFFWQLSFMTKLWVWTFMIFFQILVAHFPSCDYPFILVHIHGFALPCLDLEVPTYAMYRIGLQAGIHANHQASFFFDLIATHKT